MVNATPDSRLRFHPWHRPILRRPGEVQFGLLPEGPIVAGLTNAEVALLARLDGSRSLHTCFREAAATGVDAPRWRELVDLLVDLGLLESLPARFPSSGSVPASTLSSALGSKPPSTGRHSLAGGGGSGPNGLSDPVGPVVVDGSGPLAEQLVTLLSRDLPVRAAFTGSAAMSRSLESTSTVLSAVTVDQVTTTPALVVLVGAPALDPRSGDRWLASGTTHLPVSAAGRRTTIGPLVEGPAGPCLWCLDLLTAAELHLTAGSVAVFVQSVLAGRRPPLGISIDICLPWPRTDHRRWAVHPRCRLHDGTRPGDGRHGYDGHRVDAVGAVT